MEPVKGGTHVFTGQSLDFLDPEVKPSGSRIERAGPVDFRELLGNLPPAQLSGLHIEMLRKSAIRDEAIVARGYRTMSMEGGSVKALQWMGFSKAQIRVPALLMPLYGPSGETVLVQIRPDDPRKSKEGKSIKYETPRGVSMRMDIPPSCTRWIGDPSKPLFVTEGIKKGDSLASLGLMAIALTGVWGWRGKNEQGGSAALPEWEMIALKNRQVYIVFDSDSITNSMVQKAEFRLARFLEGRGASVRILRIPFGPEGCKQGIDDFLSSGGRMESLIGSAVNADFADQESRPKIDHLYIAEHLDDGQSLLFSHQKFWCFDEGQGIWTETPDEYVKREIQRICRLLEVPVRANFVNGTFDTARTRFFRDIRFDQTGKRSIGVRNGVLEYQNDGWVIKPYEREDYRRICLPVLYDPEAQAPRFEQFLSEVFEGTFDKSSRVLAVLEFMGLSLTTTTEFEKALLLVGSGGNGKSVLLKVLENMVGEKNRAAVQMKQLENRFQRAHLDGKLANVMSELSEGGEIPDAEIKAIISGEAITAEHKLRPPFEFLPICKLWIATNHMPSVRDLSDGLFRRFIILSFPNRFDDKPNRDTRLVETLAFEASGILNLCLRALAGVFDRGSLTEPLSSWEAVQTWKRDSDQVSQFLEEELVLDPEASMLSSEVYAMYSEWVKASGIRRVLGRKNFTQRLLTHGIEAGRGSGGIRLLHGIRKDCS